MAGISGFCNFEQNFLTKKSYWEEHLALMKNSLAHRGKSDTAPYIAAQIAVSHACTMIHHTSAAAQFDSAVLPPLSTDSQFTDCDAVICMEGEIYNQQELRSPLRAVGYTFSADTADELLLAAYLHYGPSFVSLVNGVFALAIWDNSAKCLLLFRDRAGVKPLFYSFLENTLIFASEPKALFHFPGMKPKINADSLREVLALGPAHTSGNGVFCGVKEVLPGHCLTFSPKGISDSCYWDLTAEKHTDSYETTVDTVSFLVRDAIKRQTHSALPVCTFLSGGIDSSIVTAVTAACLRKKNETLNTFSFDFTENDVYFQSNSFQPERDLPYIRIMLANCPTQHTFLECEQTTLVDALYTAVDARDVPGMADVDASLLYFCSLVAKQNQVALTGECADEIFGGYPWFYRPELLYRDGFPWSADMDARTVFLDAPLCRELQLEEYSYARYQDSLAKVPQLAGESPEEKRRRAIAYLNIKWFMQTLLDRMDRTGMYSGLKARVPFADYRIMEYLFNVPWEMKYRNGVEKSLLRDACADLLPAELLHRKKSPYPKTYHPAYEKLLEERFGAIIENGNAPLAPLIDRSKAKKFLTSHKELGKPWYGQLMAGPQLMAYFIQMNYWMEKYHLSV